MFLDARLNLAQISGFKGTNKRIPQLKVSDRFWR
jgi:hypothetical protein